MAMQLQVVRGSLFTAAAADAVAVTPAAGSGGGCLTDAEVWSRLPEELIWEVVRLVPFAKKCQLQLVSRRWRQVLTSADFRRGARGQQPVLACVVASSSSGSSRRRRTSSTSKVGKVDHHHRTQTQQEDSEVVDMDLSTRFVPPRFWARAPSGSYSVAAAADGLVCISNDREGYRGADDDYEDEWEAWARGWQRKPWTDDYCVLNPLTRTCRMLPPVPFEDLRWLPPTQAAVTVVGYMWDDDQAQQAHWGGQVFVATYHLPAAAGSRGGWDLAAVHRPDDERPRERRPRPAPPAVAQCAGETFIVYKSRLHVQAPAPPESPGGGRRRVRRLVEVAAVEEPSVALLGLDASLSVDAPQHGTPSVHLVTHRGAVYFVKALMMMSGIGGGGPGPGAADDVVAGVWRLARAGLQWEAVARLDVADLVRLLGRPLKCSLDDDTQPRRKVVVTGAAARRKLVVWGATAVRGLLCCSLLVFGERQFLTVGFNLDTGVWELVHDIWQCRLTGPLDLRPDLFL